MGTAGSDDRARQLYENHAKTCEPEDFWGQVKRTVDGKSVGQDQIDMIVETARNLLALKPSDVLLDLCCGNGALTDLVYALCAGGHGVDISPHLVNTAQTYFAAPPARTYEVADVVEFAAVTNDTERFTKAMCYGSFKYLSDDSARRLLAALRARFVNIEAFYIGNNADRTLKDKFFYRNAYASGLEDAHDTFTGRWRSEQDFRDMAQATGWSATFHRMPATFFSAHYCFDVLLMPG